MIFPEELDDKPFRLFVQRTWHALQNNLTLTPSETEIADLVADHPEVGLFFAGREIDVQQIYADDKFNPFLFLAALREITKQLKNNQPAGIRKLYDQLLDTRCSDAEARSRMAAAYLELYRQHQETMTPENKEAYLLSMREFLNDPRFFQDPLTIFMPRDGEYTHRLDIYDKAYEALKAQMYEAIANAKISLDLEWTELLQALPIEWIQATTAFWKLPKRKVKRDSIRDLCKCLQSLTVYKLREILSEPEIACLKWILTHDGMTEYDALIKKFGSEEEDDFFWNKKTPHSLPGQLRYKGLLIIGRARDAARPKKIALIPRDLHAVLSQL